jgi:hypothetical protein
MLKSFHVCYCVLLSDCGPMGIVTAFELTRSCVVLHDSGPEYVTI